MTVVTKKTDDTTGEVNLTTELYQTRLCTEIYTEQTDPQLIN